MTMLPTRSVLLFTAFLVAVMADPVLGNIRCQFRSGVEERTLPSVPSAPTGLAIADASVCTDAESGEWKPGATASWTNPGGLIAVHVAWFSGGAQVGAEKTLAAGATTESYLASTAITGSGPTLTFRVRFVNVAGTSSAVASDALATETPCASAECDAQMSEVALGAGYQDDFCSYTDIDDWGADSRYEIASEFRSNYSLGTTDPWNGKQYIRIEPQAGGYDLFPPVGPDTLGDAWFRAVMRLDEGSLATASEMLKIEADNGGGVYIDWDTGGATRIVRYTSAATIADWQPGPIDLDDGEWWEIAIHIVRDPIASSYIAVYIQHADHTGTQYSNSTTPVDGTGWMEGELQAVLRAPSNSPATGADIGAWEWADGSAHSDPFGVIS